MTPGSFFVVANCYTVQVSDTRDDATGTKAGNKKEINFLDV